MKIVYLDASTMGDTSLSEIAALGELVCYPNSSRSESLERVCDCEVLLINKVIVDSELLQRAPKLRLICEFATGVNNIDLAAAAQRGIPVKNAAGYSTWSVVQTTFMHILSLLGNAPYYDDCVKSGKYSRSGLFTDPTKSFVELSGKTVGIIGMGTIGSKVASVAEAFGAKVIYYSTSGTSHCKTYPSVDIETLLKTSDVVTIHAPLNERTKDLIGERQLSMMKRSAILINAGRGSIVDENALAKAVDEGTIAGAALDVYSKEPLEEGSPLLSVKHPERFRFTPHTAWASEEARLRLVHIVAENIKGL